MEKNAMGHGKWDGRIIAINPNLKLIELRPPMPGFDSFLGTYILQGKANAIIDPGPRISIANLIEALSQIKLSPDDIDYIIATHIHIDHSGGAGTALKYMSKAKVIVHPRARNHVIDPSRLWQASLAVLGDIARAYGEIEAVPEDRVIPASDGMKFELGDGFSPVIYFTPGHAPHHLSLFDSLHRTLLAGDAAGVCTDNVVRLSSPPPFRLQETLDTLDKLIALQPENLCYSHIGCYGNAVERLRYVRAKTLEWHKLVVPAVEKGMSVEETIAMLREKDRSMDYMNKLSKADYDRDYALLVNTVQGFMESARGSG